MPNNSGSATAEGVSSSQPNSLSAAIYRYRGDFNSYLAECVDKKSLNAGSEALARYKSSMKVLDAWDRPAESPSDAATALRLALEDYESGETDRIPVMMKAALGFLDRVSADEHSPASVDGVPSLLNVVDELGRARGMLDLVIFAVDSLSAGDMREVNALQVGLDEVQSRLDRTHCMLDSAREPHI